MCIDIYICIYIYIYTRARPPVRSAPRAEEEKVEFRFHKPRVQFVLGTAGNGQTLERPCRGPCRVMGGSQESAFTGGKIHNKTTTYTYNYNVFDIYITTCKTIQSASTRGPTGALAAPAKRVPSPTGT